MDETKRAFELLAKSLETTRLPTKEGPERSATPDEFMLMTPNPSRGWYQFKHADTRNYLLVHSETGRIHIPIGGAFLRGYFDKF